MTGLRRAHGPPRTAPSRVRLLSPAWTSPATSHAAAASRAPTSRSSSPCWAAFCAGMFIWSARERVVLRWPILLGLFALWVPSWRSGWQPLASDLFITVRRDLRRLPTPRGGARPHAARGRPVLRRPRDAFPVQQLIAHLWGPGLTPGGMFVLATPPIALLAFCSWRLVELRPSRSSAGWPRMNATWRETSRSPASSCNRDARCHRADERASVRGSSSAAARSAGRAGRASARSASNLRQALLEERLALGEHLGLVGQARDRRGEVQQQHEDEARTRRRTARSAARRSRPRWRPRPARRARPRGRAGPRR